MLFTEATLVVNCGLSTEFAHKDEPCLPDVTLKNSNKKNVDLLEGNINVVQDFVPSCLTSKNYLLSEILFSS